MSYWQGPPLVEWNDTSTRYPLDKCVHELFEQRVIEEPNATVVVYDDRQISRGELNERANQLAHHLRKIGVGPEALVGIYAQQSVEMLVGILAILKAGGAYVPMDPDYPKQRILFMLNDSNVAAILTQEDLIHELPKHDAPRILLDSNRVAISAGEEVDPVSRTTSESAACVIYTSGSTGKPKGVVITHRGLVNLAFAAATEFDLQSDDRFLQLASFSFSAALEELFPALLSGSSIIMPRDRKALASVTALLLLIDQQKVTKFEITTAHWHELVQELSSLGRQLPASLRMLVMGGERASMEKFAEWQRYGVPLIHVYGLTETAVTSTVFKSPLDFAEGHGYSELPIGRPIANTQIHLLDEGFEPVPVGVPGELYIGGDGLARGYLNRPELTAERFLPNPFSAEPGARLYRTGDLARYLPDGNIEFLGRIDHQVKIRGFRIELGEVEAALEGHPAVAQAVVVAREDEPGDKRLVAYVVPAQEQWPTVADLRAFARERLPDYMVPTTVILIEALPLTPHGKLDRRGLPVPPHVRLEKQDAYTAPRDAIELLLTDLWEEFLNLYPIGVLDNFFDMGGHSLLAIQLIAQIYDKFKYLVTISDFMRSPTIGHLSSIIRDKGNHQTGSPLVAMQPDGSNNPFYWVHPIGGTVLCYRHLAHHLGNERPFYGLQARGVDDAKEPIRYIEDLAAHYVEAIRAVQPHGPYLLGGWSMGGVVAFEMARQIEHHGQQVALLALLDSSVPTLQQIASDADDTSIASFVVDLEYSLGSSLQFSLEDLPQRDLTEQIRYLLEKIKGAHILPSDAGDTQVQRLYQVYRANTLALKQYTPKPVRTPITLFQSIETDQEESARIAAEWTNLTSDSLTLYTLPGDHFTMIENPHVEILARRLDACLKGTSI